MAAILLVILVPASQAAAAVPAVSASTENASLSTAATLYASPFAQRAGYDPAYSNEVLNAEPASGSLLVVVTFETKDPSLFVPPPTGSPPLSVAQVADRFGLSVSQYSMVEAYFVSEGLTIAHAWADRLSLTVQGPVFALDRAFGTRLLSGTYDGQAATFPDSPPTLPASIEPLVAGVAGLSSGFTSFALPLISGNAAPAVNPAQGSSGTPITPSIARNDLYDIYPLYNLTSPPTYSTDESIALLLWGWGYSPSDITTFFSQYYPSGYPQPNVEPYPVDGAPYPSSNAPSDPDSKAPQELTLDIEWSGSMAPGATLDVVYAPDGPAADNYAPTPASMADALHEAVMLQPEAISMSFGTPESLDGGLVSAWTTDLAEATQEGITLLAASGDLGGDAGSGCTGGASPEYPSSSPDVIAVGGTDVSLNTNVLGQITGFTESGWSLSGGGYSSQFGAPSWQTDTVPAIAAEGHRGIPDVSATAALDFEYYDGAAATAGGTSFGTPLWAGLVVEMDALHGSSLGFLTPRLYSIGLAEPSGKIGDGLADITTGSNCVATAGPGWDAVTGWGSPRGLALYEELTATFVNLSLSASPSAVAPGGSVTISAHLANETTGAAISGVPVTVSLTSDVNLGPCVGLFGSLKPTTNAEGNVTVSISVPYCYLGSHAVAQVTVTSDALYGVNSTTVGVDLLAFLPFLAGIATYPYNVIAFVLILGIASAIGGVLGSRWPRRAPPPGPPPGAAPAPPPSGPAPGPVASPPASPPPGAAGAPPPPPSSPAPEPPASSPPPENVSGPSPADSVPQKP